MIPAFVIALKDLRLMVRDRSGLVFTVLFPLLFGLFFGAIYAETAEGERVAPRLGWVDLSERPGGSESLRLLIARLEAEERIVPVRYDDLEAAAQAVTSRQIAAVLVLPTEFDRWFDALGGIPENPPRLRFDPGRMAESGIIEGLVTASLYAALTDSFSDPDAVARREAMLQELAAAPGQARALQLRSAAAALRSLSEGTPAGGDDSPMMRLDTAPMAVVSGATQPPNSFSITFPQAMMWGVLGCAATFAVGLVSERNSGTLLRLRTAPLTPLQILAGKGLACMAISLGVSLLFIILGRIIFDVRPVSYPTLLVALICVSFAFAGIMMLLAVIGRSKTSPGQLAWGVILVMAITGGGMLPLFFMPEWLITISHFSPVKWGILALEGGIWRGFSPAEMLLPLGVLIGIGLAGFTLGARSFMLSERIAGN